MSWSIKSTGSRAAVKAAVQSNTNVPEGIKATVTAILDEEGNAGPKGLPHDSARVEGYGHSGGGYGSIGKLEVELFTAAVLPEPADAATG